MKSACLTKVPAIQTVKSTQHGCPYVGTLFSEECNTIARLDALYVRHRLWHNITKPREIGSNLNLDFSKSRTSDHDVSQVATDTHIHIQNKMF